MGERKYSLDEIDRMRRAIDCSYGDGSYYEIERSAEIENHLRTLMQNGTTPEEAEEWSQKRRALSR